MKILVAVKRVIDYNVQIRVKEDGSGIVTDNVKMSTNPPDDNAIEEAVKIKEAGKAKEIVAITIGEEKAQETVRKALAVGADRGIHVKVDNVIEPLAVSKILKKIVEKENPDLVFMGKQAIDDDCNQTGQMLAALLNWPQATFASKIVASYFSPNISILSFCPTFANSGLTIPNANDFPILKPKSPPVALPITLPFS